MNVFFPEKNKNKQTKETKNAVFSLLSVSSFYCCCYSSVHTLRLAASAAVRNAATTDFPKSVSLTYSLSKVPPTDGGVQTNTNEARRVVPKTNKTYNGGDSSNGNNDRRTKENVTNGTAAPGISYIPLDPVAISSREARHRVLNDEGVALQERVLNGAAHVADEVAPAVHWYRVRHVLDEGSGFGVKETVGADGDGKEAHPLSCRKRCRGPPRHGARCRRW